MPLISVQIRLRPEQHQRLREEALRRRISLSALLRELVDEKLEHQGHAPRDQGGAWAFVGEGHDSAHNAAERHDDYLRRS